MNRKAAIRREDKNIWERRTPITPEDMAALSREAGLSFCVQPSEIRVFSESDYQAVGAEIREDISTCPVVFAVKEIPLELFQSENTYIFFAHVIKGQKYNMPMLQRILDLKCTLIDYEKVTDDRGRRLIFFGRHAGMAGMIDSLWALGERLEWEGLSTPFSQIQQSYHYADSSDAKAGVRHAGKWIAAEGLPESLVPFVCGFAGYGNVGQGAQEIYDELPVREISPAELLTLDNGDPRIVYKVIFKEIHTVKPRDPESAFDLARFFQHPEEFKSQFEQYIPHLSMLINAIYWTPASPRLVTKEYLRWQYSQTARPIKLKVIGDISCDVEGGIEATVRSTEPDEPVFVWEPATGEAPAGVAGDGPVIMAVDNLPCELPAESSADFSSALREYIPAIVTADYSVPFSDCALPPEIKRAVIVYQGELTPDYNYIRQFLNQ
jgi:alpha-aminoadipic semialdehyde synthase